MNPKTLTVVAGPNGSGKSTLISHLLSLGYDLGEYINADDIATNFGLKGDEGSREAQRLADAARERCLKRDSDFSFETVMSHESKVEFMERAKNHSFFVNLFFVATSDPELNVERVSARVKQGGHDVPTDRVLARYERTLSLLPRAIVAASETTVFDNSHNARIGPGGLRPVMKARNRVVHIELEFRPPVPGWLLTRLNFSQTKWCFHKAYVDSDNVVFAHLVKLSSVAINQTIGLGAPVWELMTALNQLNAGQELVLHPLK